MTDEPFTLSALKAELDSALIQLATQRGIPDHDPLLNRVREAGDALFSGGIRRKFEILADTGRGHQDMLRRRAEVGAREPGLVP